MWARYKDRPIYLDSNIIIYAIEQGSQWAETIRALLGAVDADDVRVVTSELTIAEVMPKPISFKNPDYLEKYQSFFSPLSPLLTVPVSRDILLSSCHPVIYRPNWGLNRWMRSMWRLRGRPEVSIF
ncbi:PIN domain-containing protein [Rhodopseudomonas sp. BR0M22]|uniref:type II toxin-antitoxin system VapC family toxin n=1 Tax=Rhodopseudomonas sp. BR0M22 TaxID=2269369 RepID=UPI0013E01DA3|nr:PIN domain-containing protein [Rhodopseudomonas sp. BR0M22]